MENQIILYQTESSNVNLNVKFYNESFWLTQKNIAQLFGKGRSTITEHISNIYKEEELEQNSTRRNFRQVRMEGNREVEREIEYYNLDVIISVGYRVKSIQGTRFRQWATQRLKEYIVKGFTMDDERLKNLGGGVFWKELLDRIREIRSSEKVMYRQVLEIFNSVIGNKKALS